LTRCLGRLEAPRAASCRPVLRWLPRALHSCTAVDSTPMRNGSKHQCVTSSAHRARTVPFAGRPIRRRYCYCLLCRRARRWRCSHERGNEFRAHAFHTTTPLLQARDGRAQLRHRIEQFVNHVLQNTVARSVSYQTIWGNAKLAGEERRSGRGSEAANCLPLQRSVLGGTDLGPQGAEARGGECRA